VRLAHHQALSRSVTVRSRRYGGPTRGWPTREPAQRAREHGRPLAGGTATHSTARPDHGKPTRDGATCVPNFVESLANPAPRGVRLRGPCAPWKWAEVDARSEAGRWRSRFEAAGRKWLAVLEKANEARRTTKDALALKAEVARPRQLLAEAGVESGRHSPISLRAGGGAAAQGGAGRGGPGPRNPGAASGPFEGAEPTRRRCAGCCTMQCGSTTPPVGCATRRTGSRHFRTIPLAGEGPGTGAPSPYSSAPRFDDATHSCSLVITIITIRLYITLYEVAE